MLSPIQHLAVKYLAGGWTCTRTANELKLDAKLVRKWRSVDPEFGKALGMAVAHHAELVEAMLIAGEAKAAETLISALTAESVPGRPNWNVRVTAAVTLLDRAGQRGRAVEKSLVGVASMQKGAGGNPQEIEESLRKALRDPGVRAWLKESGAVPQLTAGGGGDEILTDVSAPTDQEEVA